MLKLKLKNIIYIILYAIPNTILSFGILYIINNTISGNANFQKDYIWIVYGAVIVYSYLLNIVFQKKLNEYSYNVLYENEKNIFKKILNAPLSKLERYGPQRFYTAIEDIRVFGTFSSVVTHTINSLLMLILCFTYMFTISFISGLIILGIVVLVASLFFLVTNSMSEKIKVLRKSNEQYYSFVHDVIRGFKNLKVDRSKRYNLMKDHLTPNRDKAKQLDFNINFVFISINLISQYGLYLAIGAIVFLFPAFDLLLKEEVASYVVILIFISGPINNLINMQNIYAQYIASNTRIKRFLADFDNEQTHEKELSNTLCNDFNFIELRNVCFNYQNENSENVFGIGPIDLKIQKGEVIFVIGGNGSGKSTFINILTGLYRASNGEIRMDHSTGNIVNIQDHIAAIFTDNHIFSHNYDNYSLKNNSIYKELLKTMEMDEITGDDEEHSARRNFSKGQSKRMSMIFALLENKPVLILDEWAADQDPYFRKFFYEKLLPRLKAEGKTIIAVTHDDSYFKHADRIIKFDYGKIVKDFNVSNGENYSEMLWKQKSTI